MVRLLLTIAIIVISVPMFSQNLLYETMQQGSYEVGFCDTLLIDDTRSYEQFGYSGGAPFFVKIWHPIKEGEGNYLNYNEFRTKPDLTELKEVYQQLVMNMDSAFTWYNVETDFVKYEDINYKNKTAYEVKDFIIENTQTISRFKEIDINKGDFPVIFYHHGAQGLADENYLMAEFFASHGYIFVSSNFHWPFEGKSYGYNTDYNYNIRGAQFMSDFVQDLAADQKSFFIGHSWGAQTGFSVLFEDLGYEAFVSMETTLEYYDSPKIKKVWPKLDSIMRLRKEDYELPMLLFANSGKASEFDFRFFQLINNAKMCHLSYKEEFGHESYTGIYLLRYLYKKQFKEPDNRAVKKQLEGYFKHLNVIKQFIESDHQKATLLDGFSKDFYIKTYNYN